MKNLTLVLYLSYMRIYGPDAHYLLLTPYSTIYGRKSA